MFTFPESVRSYFSDARVKTAVDLLLSRKSPRVEASDWGEVKSFYRAYLAANQVRADFGEALFEIWHDVWEPPNTLWEPLGPEQQAEAYGWPVDLATVWEDEMFPRIFRARENKALSLYLAVGLDREDGIQIGFGLFDDDDKSKIIDAPGWEISDANDLWWSPASSLPFAATIDLTTLTDLAEVALRMAQSGVEGALIGREG